MNTCKNCIDLKAEEKRIINNTKKLIAKTAMDCKTGHIPSSYSCLEILYTLYNREIANINKNNANDLIRDRIILSKEHARLGHVCLLAELGLIPKNIIPTWQQNDGEIGHDLFGSKKNPKLAIIDPSSSSLGHGLGLGIGFAIAAKSNNIFVIVGDGELQEGSLWEAIMYIGHHQIKNITLIVDRNYVQIECKTKDMIDTSSKIIEQITPFGFDCIECNGHDTNELYKAFKTVVQRPKCIVANTIKGKECEFLLENRSYAYFHSCTYTTDEYLKIIGDII